VNRVRLLVAVVFLTMTLSVVQAVADISLVADLDSNATNGPDTLLVEPTDTVTVYLWLTGTDSASALGVTIGDTTGSLLWVGDTTGAVYRTPLGWSNGPTVPDGSGWVLLQATDWSGALSLHPPCEFARLQFYVSPGDSCGSLSWDPEMCGWYNQDLGDSVFVSFERPVICVDSVLAAREGDSGGAEASEDPGESSEADQGGSADSPFVRELVVPESVFLFVNGARLKDTISCSWEVGGALRLGGQQALSPGQSQELTLSEARLSEMTKDIPFVLQRIREGIALRQACLEWESAVRSAQRAFYRAYHDTWAESRSETLARVAAAEVLMSEGGEVVSEAGAMWTEGEARITWAGYGHPTVFSETRMRSFQWEDPAPEPSITSARGLLSTLGALLKEGRPSVIVLFRGDIISVSSDTSEHSEVARILAQISASTEDNVVSGHLPREAVLEILRHGGTGQ